MSGSDSYRPGRSSYQPGRRAQQHEHRYDHYDRPPPPPPPSRGHDGAPPPPPRDNDMFHFKGAAGVDNRRQNEARYDTYRSNDYNRPANTYAWNNDNRGQPSYGHTADVARHNEFDFRPTNVENAPSFPATKPQAPNRRRDRENTRGRGRGGRHPRGGRGSKKASDRAIFQARRSPTPEQLAGMRAGESRFKPLELLSDSGEEDMDLNSSDESTRAAARLRGEQAVKPEEDSDDDEHPRAKRARLGSPTAAKLQEAPKWSNPDPYTALPPPGESHAKGKDVMRLIRKAKVDAIRTQDSKAASGDFISLDFNNPNDDDDDSSSSSVVERSPPPPRSQHRSFSHLDNLHPNRTTSANASESSRAVQRGTPDLADNVDVWPPNSTLQTAIAKQDAAALASQPARQNGRKRKQPTRDTGSLNGAWEIYDESVDPTPWLPEDDAQCPNADVMLHNEILNFYDYVKPRPYEDEVRENLIYRIRNAFRTAFPHVQVHAFGSFASGLYLPTADMDLVALTDSFRQTGMPSLIVKGNMRLMRNISGALQDANLIKPGSVTLIPMARVPIIKFVERVTGLRVDISFENNSGLIANETFDRWKETYPAMPMIVCLIKQFLAMRDLSDVSSGGLGGYSIICLVVCTIHFLEQKNGPPWSARGHLDEVLLTFLEHYGNKFNLELAGLDMDRMSYISKDSFHGKRSKPGRLLIVDPNNPTNDISGGSSSVRDIFNLFRNAHDALCDRMTVAERANGTEHTPVSILGAIWAGNYESFQVQRARLQELHVNGNREVPLAVASKANEQARAPAKRPKKPKPAKEKKEKNKEGLKKTQKHNKDIKKVAEVERAETFKAKHPGFDVPGKLSKRQHASLKRQARAIRQKENQ